MRNLILASTSTLHGGSYLEYLLPEIKKHFLGCSEVLFIPYARPGGITHEAYTELVFSTFQHINIHVKGIHEASNPKEALLEAKAIFTGGGNTFLLVWELYRNNLMAVLKEVLNSGIPYLGTSAGTNIAGLSMKTTNDMPIVYPPSFNTLGLVPFNINPHYIDADPFSTHKGETRETRIKEFHKFNPQPVVGLREGSWLEVKEHNIILKGDKAARIFEAEKLAFELENGRSLNDLN